MIFPYEISLLSWGFQQQIGLFLGGQHQFEEGRQLPMGAFASASFVAKEKSACPLPHFESQVSFRVSNTCCRHKTSLLSVPAQPWPHRIHRVLQKISAVPGAVEVGLKKQFLKIKVVYLFPSHNATMQYGWWTKIDMVVVQYYKYHWDLGQNMSKSKTREAIYAYIYIYIYIYAIVLVILIQKSIRDGSVGPTFHRPPAVATAGRCLSPLVGTGKRSLNSRVIKIWPTDTPKSSYIWWNCLFSVEEIAVLVECSQHDIHWCPFLNQMEW